ncbi:MAG: phage antirepressor KilAC domain-containing protein [Candidatus Stygibacter australis]|nr:phage antirepressor KilAC domain-containing protein [Candidatus Stygibacter australis]MDP8320871.1 phage antirepressor KilAC domain-containing protein [Candidatus Stygibacter australis]
MDIKTYTNGMYNIDTIVVDGDIYFRGDQTGYALGYKNPGKAIRDHCIQDGVRKVNIIIAGDNQLVTYISERNLLRLISSTRLESSIDFEEWIYEEVLPSIRNTCVYATDKMIDKIIDDPELGIRLFTALKEERNNKKPGKELEISAPKIEFYDAITGSKDSVYMYEVAQVLKVKGMGEMKLFKYLRYKSILMHNNEPYQRYMDRGYFECVVSHYTAHGEIKLRLTTKVTPKGQTFIRKILRKDGYDTRN